MRENKTDKEIWKDIQGYEGLYQVSNFGRVKSLDRYVNAKLGSKMMRKGVIMTLQTSHKGYNVVMLHKNCKGHQQQVHRLVAIAFIPNPLNKPQVNHMDCNKKNNHISNLEWATQDENMHHASINGIFSNFNERRLRASRENLLMAINKRKRKINQYTIDGQFIKQYTSIAEAEKETGASNSRIVRCCKGERKSTHGYKWEYAKEA